MSDHEDSQPAANQEDGHPEQIQRVIHNEQQQREGNSIEANDVDEHGDNRNLIGSHINQNEHDNRGNQNNNRANQQAAEQRARSINQANPRYERINRQELELNNASEVGIFTRPNKTTLLLTLLILAAVLYGFFTYTILKQHSFVLSSTSLKSDIQKLRQDKQQINKYLGILNAHQTIRDFEQIDEELIRKIQKTKSQRLYKTGLLLLNCSKDFTKKDQQVIQYHEGIQKLVNHPINQ